ncbi:MAG TPA: hypothetical protein VFE32_16225 [Puia sp.]|jgi:hypothetical protein|nr:hypothetical protein [Puia sp.]
MKLRSLLILLVLIVAVVPMYYMHRWMKGVMKPKENAGRLFIFMLATFVLIVIYTMLVIGLIVRLFPLR